MTGTRLLFLNRIGLDIAIDDDDDVDAVRVEGLRHSNERLEAR